MTLPTGYRAALFTPIETIYGDYKVPCRKCGCDRQVLRSWALENPWGAFDFNYALELECGHTETTIPIPLPQASIKSRRKSDVRHQRDLR
jgi:hypothetical protein